MFTRRVYGAPAVDDVGARDSGRAAWQYAAEADRLRHFPRAGRPRARSSPMSSPVVGPAMLRLSLGRQRREPAGQILPAAGGVPHAHVVVTVTPTASLSISSREHVIHER